MIILYVAVGPAGGEKPVQQDWAGQRKAFHYTVLHVKKKATRSSVHLSTGC